MEENSVLFNIQEALGKLDAKYDSLKEQISLLNKFILGNGQKGVLDRMTKIEEQVSQGNDISFSNSRSIKDLAQAVEKLSDMIEKHVENKDIHFSFENSVKDVITKKDFWFLIIGGFIILHTLIEDGGPILKWLLALLGIHI